jgi:3-deoxy-D-manno-octulosonic-acid transferase
VHLYNTFLTLTVIGTTPLWGGLLLGKPKHRAGFLQKATGRGLGRDERSPSPIWYHAVSVGEVMASLPLIRGLMEGCAGRPVWISTVTGTGQATARAHVPQAARTFYFPYDHPWIVDRAIRAMRPALFVTTETELWPNCVWRLYRYGVPIALINGRISDDSFDWYRRFRFLFRDILGYFDSLCMQSDLAASRIRALGAPAHRVHVTGNLKFDQELPHPVDQELWRGRLGLLGQEPVWVAGSTHTGEEEIILRVFRRLCNSLPTLRLILAPRAPERFEEVAALAGRMGFRVARRSVQATGGTQMTPSVTLLDTIGELSQVYAVADVGFVGGSLVPRGGHNPLEIAAHGRPVLFGPHMENFREVASLLLNGGGAIEAAGEELLERKVREVVEAPALAHDMGEKARKVLISQRGATKRTLDALRPMVERASWD